MKSKIRNLIAESFDLITTIQPQSAAYKVFTGAQLHGGPQTKLGQLRAGAANRGERYGTVVCLSAARVPLTVLRLLRQRGARIVVNQNGVYYPLWCPEGFRSRNRFLRVLNRVAHHSFFQSRFSEISFERWVGPLPATRSILLNAVDRSRFFPSGEPPSDPLRALVFLDFREFNAVLWSHLAPLLRSAVPGFRFTLMGQRDTSGFAERLQEKLAGVPIDWHFDADQATVARVLRGCDVALHFVFNDVCPNKVIECLASGVYVICGSAGGSAELVARGGGEALPVPAGFERRAYPSAPDILAALERFRANPAKLKREAAVAGVNFDLTPWLKAMTRSTYA
jgi:glycosyltransferase involved in cell wall biosynthesis